jgi:peptidoglycan/LPS O-acetylase OafA/YrhL
LPNRDHVSSSHPNVDRESPGGFVHIPALDGIRGLAILLVLADHLLWANRNTGSRLLDLFQEFRVAAYCGVNLFFTLSGFLITGILIDTLSVPHYFRTFYVRRALRIFPLYYGSLGALLLLTHPFHFQWNGWQYYYLTYTENVALWRSSVPLDLGRFNINQFWSLQVEEQFYFIWPFIVFRIKRPASLARVALLLCVPILMLRIFFVLMKGHPHFTWMYLPYSPTFSCADNILFGCALGAMLRTTGRETILRLAPRALALCSVALPLTFVLHHGLDWMVGFFMPTFGFSLLGLTGAALIATTLKRGSLAQRIFSLRSLRFFGKYSYGLYVFHYSIEGFLSGPLRAATFAHLHSKSLAVLLPAIVILGLSIIAALLSYHLYESQFLHLKRYFGYARTATSKVPVALAP